MCGWGHGGGGREGGRDGREGGRERGSDKCIMNSARVVRMDEKERNVSFG